MPMDRRYIVAICVVALLLSFWAGVKYSDWKGTDQTDEVLALQEDSLREEGAGESGIIQVYVTGEVSKPGVYTMQDGDRVHQVIDLAMPTEKADLRAINLAQRLADEEAILVPAQGEAGTLLNEAGGNSFASPGSSGSKNGKVNINTASVSELDERLPGIGPALAQRIIDYRTQNGAFKNIEDICSVSGIGTKRYEQIKDMISVR